MRQFVLTLIAIPMLCASAAATTIYEHNFGGFGNPINGTAVDVGGAIWEAGDLFLDDGTISGSTNGAFEGAALLPFVPTDGRVYTLAATITNDEPGWIGFGFLDTRVSDLFTNGAGFSGLNTAQSRHAQAGGYAWMLTREDNQEGFAGRNTANGVFSAANDTSSALDIEIILDTTAGVGSWTVEYLVDGVSQGSSGLVASASDITYVGFSRDVPGGGTGDALVGNFSLTFVPEPSSLALIAVGACSLLVRRKS